MYLDLHSEVLGDKDAPVVIILHGLFGSTSNWRSISRELSKTHRVISLDLRNHGKSPWHDSMTYADLAGDVMHYIERNSLEHSKIIGHSMGGKTAMTLLQKFEITTGKVFIIDIAPVSYRHDHNLFIQVMQSIEFNQISSRQQVDEQLARMIDDYGVRQFLMQNLDREGGRYSWRINLHAIAKNMPEIMGYQRNHAVENDVVFISGDQSGYIRPEYHGTIKSQFPNSVIETIQGAGHWLHAEKPQALLQILEKYPE